MFEIFGEFNTAEELNQKAEELRKVDNQEELKKLAEENGIDKEDAEDFIDGSVSVMATPLMAAFGKLKVEAKELQPYEIMEDWLQYINLRCAEEKNMAAAVRKKGKSLKGCIAALLTWSMKNAKPVDKEILKQVNISYQVTLGIPGIGRAKQIITDYYMG